MTDDLNPQWERHFEVITEQKKKLRDAAGS